MAIMKTQQPEKTDAQQKESHAGERLHAVILQQVIHQLGQPPGRNRIQVRKLWEDRYRVNILTGPDASAETIAHSFFLVTDDNGTIVAATPRITKQY